MKPAAPGRQRLWDAALKFGKVSLSAKKHHFGRGMMASHAQTLKAF